MAKILNVKAREILDSRGNPTVECDVRLMKMSITMIDDGVKWSSRDDNRDDNNEMDDD